MKKLFGLVLVLFSLQSQADTTHQLSIQVTNQNTGMPAEELTAVLYKFGETSSAWRHINTKKTDAAGRIDDFLEGLDHQGVYRLVLRSGRYFQENGRSSLYPLIPIVLNIESGKQVHLPVMLSTDGYSVTRDAKASEKH